MIAIAKKIAAIIVGMLAKINLKNKISITTIFLKDQTNFHKEFDINKK
mgnify:CR=1 FL=1